MRLARNQQSLSFILPLAFSSRDFCSFICREKKSALIFLQKPAMNFVYQTNSNKTVERNVIKNLKSTKINVSTIMGRNASELHWIMDIF